MPNLLISLWLSLAALLCEPDSAHILFVGDAMQHDRQLTAARVGNYQYDYQPSFSEVADFVRSADYAVVNLETPLGGKPYSGYPMFCAPVSYLDALTDAGFDFFLGANNHALDRRDRGVKRTIEQFKKRALPWAGIYTDQAERDTLSPRIVDIKGFQVALLNYTYGTNGITIQGDIKVDPIDLKLIKSDLAKARRNGAELTAVCIHWGEEYHLLPSRRQRNLADTLCRLGVDMVIGSHPHVIQPMELRCDSTTGRRQLVVYSLGNFISAMRTRDTRGGAGVNVYLRRDSTGRALLDSATYTLFFTETPLSPTTPYKLRDAETPIDNNQPAEQQRLEFVKSATDVFSKHNINVPFEPISH